MKIGLLPLYITLYDETSLLPRERLGKFYDTIAKVFENKGIEVVTNDFCMENDHFAAAVGKFESEKCDAIVTLHMAYSPSLKSIDALKKTQLPIIVLDTTDTFDFSDRQTPQQIMYCHGIHGVMDMCNMLKKNGRPYAIAAGYYESGEVVDRAIGYLKAAVSANAVIGSRVGVIGGEFDGMGDFRMPDEKLKKLFGVETVYVKDGDIDRLLKTVTDAEITVEKERNKKDFEFIGEVDEAVYTNSVKADITLKKWIGENRLDALTVNFRNIGVLPTMPFNGICRTMQEGIGYAGEGDKFTATFVGGLLKGYHDTSFIEIFCPDWKNGTLFISHMGEMNYNVAGKKPEFFEKKFEYADCPNPMVGTASFCGGSAVYLNVFEDGRGINMLISPMTVLDETTGNFKKNIRGWIKPHMPLPEFLKEISRYGVTHHSILVYGARVEEMEFFADCLHINPIVL